MAVRVAVLSSLLIVVACSSDPGEAAGVAVRDSAGIRIVDLPSTSTVAVRFQVSEEPVYRVGWSDVGHWFEDVVAGGLWPDGRAIVADGGATLEVVVLSATGSVDAVLGGPGQGPGELMGIFAIVPLGEDTVVVQDPRNARVTFFDGAGAIGTVHLTTPGYPRLLGNTQDGGLLMGPPLYVVQGRRYETPWLSVPLLKVDPSTGAADTLARVDWDQSIFLGGGNSPFMSGGFATVTDGRVVVGRGDRPEVRWLDDQGLVRQIARWRDDPRPVPPSMIAEWEREMRVFFERSGRLSQADIEARISSMKGAIDEPLPFFGMPGPMPDYGGLIADPHGNVWIASYLAPRVNSPRRYYVVSPQGEWVGWAEMPEGLRVLAIGANHVLGVERNALDVQAVTLYRLSEANAR